jgi:2-polyprenyl-3-methyl-5-hydroxy-6-metoxy-1,4-benzoquinol methylase
MSAWTEAKQIIGERRVTLGPSASQQWLDAPDHLAMVLARYRAAAALIGNAATVLELGAGEGVGANILAKGRAKYIGFDNDHDAMCVAQEYEDTTNEFEYADVLDAPDWLHGQFSAVVSLDVIEHLPTERVPEFMRTVTFALMDTGVCVIGTPNAAFDHLASPQSKAGHCNTYTHERLHALMSMHFHVVQSFGMQDTSIHFGHPEARHYLMFCGIGPKSSAEGV